MRSFLAGLIVAVIILAIALLAAAIGALGVGAVGWLLTLVFELSQWEGTLVAFGVAISLGLLVYRIVTHPFPTTWESVASDYEDEEEEEEEEEAPPIVQWRRSRPTPGTLPSENRSGSRSKRKTGQK